MLSQSASDAFHRSVDGSGAAPVAAGGPAADYLPAPHRQVAVAYTPIVRPMISFMISVVPP